MTGQVALPQTAALAFNTANAAFKQHDYHAALAQADAALVIAPDFAMALMMRARCLQALNDLLGVLQTYEAVLTSEPQNFSAHLEIGNVHNQSGEADRAEALYLKAISCRLDDPRGYLALALFLPRQTGQEPLTERRGGITAP